MNAKQRRKLIREMKERVLVEKTIAALEGADIAQWWAEEMVGHRHKFYEALAAKRQTDYDRRHHFIESHSHSYGYDSLTRRYEWEEP
jgi:hypothetical protein